jgi:hypothetical protein
MAMALFLRPFSRYGGRKASKNGPTSPMKPDLLEKKRMFGSNGRLTVTVSFPAPQNRRNFAQLYTVLGIR